MDFKMSMICANITMLLYFGGYLGARSIHDKYNHTMVAMSGVLIGLGLIGLVIFICEVRLWDL